MQNIRARRGRKVIINIPVFKDVKTADPFVESFAPEVDVNGEAAAASKPDCIYMDANAFGSGCCCLQVSIHSLIDTKSYLY